MSDEEKLQNLAVEQRALEGYYNELNARETMLNNIIIESRAAMESLENLPQATLSEVLVPIGGGIYVRTQTPPPDSLIVSIGANVAIEKTRDGTLTFLEERIREIEKALLSIGTQKGDLGREINARRSEINRLIQKLK